MTSNFISDVKDNSKRVEYKLRLSGMNVNDYILLTEKEGEIVKKIILNGKVKFIELSAGHLININSIVSIQKINIKIFE